jgi:hypothetical protein
MTSPVGLSPGPPPRMPPPWWERHLSIDRLILICLVLINGGRFWQGQENTNNSLAEKIGRVELRLTAAEAMTRSEHDQSTSAFMRADVMRVWMDAVDQRLASIERKIDAQKGGPR